VPPDPSRLRPGAASGPRRAEHFFRRQYGQLVATLARVVGFQHLALAEDAVQSAFMTALEAWANEGPPRDPGSWLYRVAYNRLIGDLRRKAGQRRILEQTPDAGAEAPIDTPASRLAGEVPDDLLRMLFVCCDDAIPMESRLVLALKTLCGFGTAEIALRLFITEANVHKRLARARKKLAAIAPDLETPPLADLRSRLPGVHAVLYLLFNEGYLPASGEEAIRRELCDEAVRLTTLLAEHPVGAVPETFALLALMHLHVARLGARRDGLGGLLLLEEQDRSLWDREGLQLGMQWLARAASGDVFSRYHAEAGIAAEHGLAPTFAETRWKEIVDLYAMLEHAAPSPLHRMNRAVAVAEWRGPAAGLAVLQGMVPPPWLAGSYLWEAVSSDLQRRSGDAALAARHRERALALAPTEALRDLLRRRLAPR
jgi:RNA polymerase sigma-70 factor (ECF subfamily)